MDEHFAAVLGTSGAVEAGRGGGADFILSASFSGPRPGFVFGTGDRGTGYYLDGGGGGGRAKRARAAGISEELEGDGHGGERAKRAASLAAAEQRAAAGLGAADGAALLEAAELAAEGRAEAVIDFDLDLPGLKILLLGFEKKINKNQRLRVKFGGEPARFVESEVELDEEIKKLFAVAASPELYPAFVELGAAKSLLGLLAHDNTDVSLAVVALLQVPPLLLARPAPLLLPPPPPPPLPPSLAPAGLTKGARRCCALLVCAACGARWCWCGQWCWCRCWLRAAAAAAGAHRSRDGHGGGGGHGGPRERPRGQPGGLSKGLCTTATHCR